MSMFQWLDRYKLFVCLLVCLAVDGIFLCQFIFQETKFVKPGISSAIVMNHDRCENVFEIAKTIVNYIEIDEILIGHTNSEAFECVESLLDKLIESNHIDNRDFTRKNRLNKMNAINGINDNYVKLHQNDTDKEELIQILNGKQIRHYKRFNNEYGSAERYFVAQYSKKNWLLFVDDDILPRNNLIKKLINKLSKDEIEIYGPFGRECNNEGYYVHGQKPNMVLPRILMTSKTVNNNYIDLNNFQRYQAFLQSTHGNAEDISYNMEFTRKFGKIPKVVRIARNWPRWMVDINIFDFRPFGDGIIELSAKTQHAGGAYSKRPKHLIQRNMFCRNFSNPQS